MAETRLLSEEADQRRVLHRTWPYLRPHRRLLLGAVLVNLGSTVALTLVPLLIGLAVDEIRTGDRPGLIRLSAGVIALVVARMVLLRWAEILLVRVGERVVRDLRDRAVERISAAPLRFLETHRGGDLLQRVTAEIAELASFVRGQVPDLISLSGYVSFTTVLLLVTSWQLTLLLAAVFAPLMWFIGRRFRAAAELAYAREATAQATVTATYAESLQAREQLQVARAAGQWQGRLAADLAAYRRAVRGTQRSLSWLETAWIVQGLVTAVLLVSGGHLVAAGVISVGVVVTFVIASRELFSSVDDLTYVAGELVASRVGLARLLDLLDATEPGSIGTPAGGLGAVPAARPAPARRPSAGDLLVADDVHYGYGTAAPVLRGVTLGIGAGDRVALVGETGSGKTTLAKLLCGLYVPDAGTVRCAGVDLADLDYAELRRRLVLVPQQVHMITGTVADNLALAPGEPGRADFERAVERLDLGDWIAGLPAGLDTHLGPRGAHLSAGERQLIGLIRAALLRPEVVVLDEATADLDPDTAHRLETAVGHLHVDRALIVIAHRPATIERLSRVVRMADGQLVES